MKLYYIGTGAADWTRESGAKDGVMRKFTANLINHDLMIDLAPTTPLSLFDEGGLCEAVRYIVYTHSHNDHYDAGVLLTLLEKKQLTVLCHKVFASRLPSHPNLEVMSLESENEVSLGEYTILPLRANHRVTRYPEEQPLHYVISCEGKKLFWGADGAWLYCDTWQALRKQAPFDRIVLDGTLGEGEGDYRIFEHNNLPMVRLMRDTFTRLNLLKDGGQLWLTHLSRDAHISPISLARALREENIYVANDDMKDEF